jgi:NADH dehydrogenase (ubiquinone) 1 alpha subcomplex subunit 6
MDLVETTQIWKQRPHIMKYFQDSVNKRPTDFLGKFYDGHDPWTHVM